MLYRKVRQILLAVTRAIGPREFNSKVDDEIDGPEQQLIPEWLLPKWLLKQYPSLRVVKGALTKKLQSMKGLVHMSRKS